MIFLCILVKNKERKVYKMKDYAKETKKMVTELMQDLVSEKALFVKELEVTWNPERVTNAGENKCESSELAITILVPKVNVKLQ